MEHTTRPGPRVFTTTASAVAACPDHRMDPGHFGEDGRCLHMTIVPCRWFALCDRPADVYVPHPVLGSVPTCARCRARAEEEDR